MVGKGLSSVGSTVVAFGLSLRENRGNCRSR
jgi:hypothetical protein